MENITCIFDSVDSFDSRKNIDELCFKNSIPFFDCGIDGSKGYNQSIIPFITETYSSSTDIDNNKNYMECIITNFPNNINHTIKWTQNNFDFFIRAPNTFNNYIQNNKFIGV